MSSTGKVSASFERSARRLVGRKKPNQLPPSSTGPPAGLAMSPPPNADRSGGANQMFDGGKSQSVRKNGWTRDPTGDAQPPFSDFAGRDDGFSDTTPGSDSEDRWLSGALGHFDPESGALITKVRATLMRQIVPSSIVADGLPSTQFGLTLKPEVFMGPVKQMISDRKKIDPDSDYVAVGSRIIQVDLVQYLNELPYPVGINMPGKEELGQSSLNSQTGYLAILPPSNDMVVLKEEVSNITQKMLTHEMQTIGIHTFKNSLYSELSGNPQGAKWLARSGLVWNIANKNPAIIDAATLQQIRPSTDNQHVRVDDSHLAIAEMEFDRYQRTFIPVHNLHEEVKFEFSRLTAAPIPLVTDEPIYAFSSVDDIGTDAMVLGYHQWNPEQKFKICVTFDFYVVIPRIEVLSEPKAYAI